MKALAVTAVFCVLICVVQSEIGLNLSASLNPGFSIVPSRRRHVRIGDDQGEDETSWPSPDTIHGFPVPETFVNAVTEVPEGTEEPTSEAARNRPRHHRSHRH